MYAKSEGSPSEGGRDSDGIAQREYNSLLQKRSCRGWCTNEWREQLTNRGANIAYTDRTIPVPHPDEEEGSVKTGKQSSRTQRRTNPILSGQGDFHIGTSDLRRSETKLEMTYIPGLNMPDYVDFSWSLKDPWIVSVEKPVDIAIIQVEHNDYTFPSGMDCGPWVSPLESENEPGPGLRVGEYRADKHSNRTIGRFGSYMSVPIEPVTDSLSDRSIYFNYVARWGGSPDPPTVSPHGTLTIPCGEESDLWWATAHASEEDMYCGDPHEKEYPVK